MWLAPTDDVVKAMQEEGLVVGSGLIGMANVLVEVAPLFVMCDPQDLGTVVNASCLKREALFLHDRYPGGMGYARRCLQCFDEILQTIRDVIHNCSCDDGCPSCVGAALTTEALTDLDSSVRGRIPNKAAALYMLERWPNQVPE